MIESILKYGSVYLASMFKFVLGPVTGLAQQLSFIETAIFTALGMMTTVFIISMLGEPVRKKLIQLIRGNNRLFTPRNRRIVKIWSRFGVKGVAFLTPLLFSPLGGTVIAVSFGGSRKMLFRYMAISAVFWGFTQALFFQYFGTMIFG